MKKFIATLCIVLLSLCLFVGCADDLQNTIDLEKCEIGDELPIYPNFEFDYKVNDEITVHVNSIKLILTEKNTIKQNEVNEGYYYPYTMTIKVSATTSPSNAGKKLEFVLTNGANGYSLYNTVNSDGTIEWEENRATYSLKIYFSSISVVNS